LVKEVKKLSSWAVKIIDALIIYTYVAFYPMLDHDHTHEIIIDYFKTYYLM